MNNMKKIIITSICLLMVLAASAQQGQRRFSPERFQAEMEQYIIQEAKLSTQEADRFLPIFREMHQKQRVIYECQRQLRHTNLYDETAYMEAIRKNDQMDIELKTIQKNYHEKFMTVLPASKVFDVIRAEDRFHREMWKKWNHKKRK